MCGDTLAGNAARQTFKNAPPLDAYANGQQSFEAVFPDHQRGVRKMKMTIPRADMALVWLSLEDLQLIAGGLGDRMPPEMAGEVRNAELRAKANEATFTPEEAQTYRNWAIPPQSLD
jgi:hypothetical protein